MSAVLPTRTGSPTLPADSTLVSDNPLLAEWAGELGLPPFARIEPAHFKPAFDVAMQRHLAEVALIADDPSPPDFANTLAAFDRAGALLNRVEAVLHNLSASLTSPALQAVQREMAAPLAAHESAVMMNAALFRRIDDLHARRESLGLDPEQMQLLLRLHTDFVLAGARMDGAAQKRYAQLMQQLAELTTRFSQNVLADEAAFELPLREDADFEGLPDFLVAASREAGRARGHAAGIGVITLSRSLIEPFLVFSPRRDLREQAWRAWVGRGENGGESDNRELIREILRLRRQQALEHGRDSYADHALADTMAGTPAAVRELLMQVWPRALKAAAAEREALIEVMRAEGADEDLQAWDWRYWSQKVRQQRYDIDEAALKPYFSLDRMIDAAFDCAHRLFGVRMVARDDVAGYHPDVRVWEMFDAQGRSAGVFLHDNYARQTKRSGAWMSDFVYSSRNRGVDRPIIVNNNNFAQGASGEPTLLSFDDARTLFHEFGHALHGLLSNTTYHRLSGTQVLRDFVELPSQLFEHWLGEPALLREHARHWKTGDPLPDAMVDRLRAAERWGQGYETVSYCGSALVDLQVHRLTDVEPPRDITVFEQQVLQEIGMPPAIGMRHRLPHFLHLFAGPYYASAYYVYLWAETLDADAYDAFTETGDPFDPDVARRLLEHIYSVGGSVPPQQAYVNYRGRLPALEPLLRNRGLLDQGAPAPA